MRVQGRLRWWVSSPLDFVIEGVALGLLEQREVRLGTSFLHVSQVEVLPAPSFSGTMTLATLSPIFVSTGQGVTTEKLQKRFLSPQNPDFARVLNDNLRRKSIALHGQPFEGELHFEWLDDPKSKLMRVSDLQIRGWMMRFRVTGPVELIQLGYDAGFGERNAQGFGMVSVLEHHPHFAARNLSAAGPQHSNRGLPSRRRPRP
jgi:CRISPR-associated endoribonuclease Cas6